MTNTVIVDLDNCISNDGWRTKFIRWDLSDPTDRYRDYHLLAGFDLPANLNHIADLALAYEIAVFTARPSLYSVITEEWLRRQSVNWSILMMRETGEHGPSVELKEAQLKFLLAQEPQRNIVLALDDREDVVEMYRRNGVRAQQLAINAHSMNLENKERTCPQPIPVLIAKAN